MSAESAYRCLVNAGVQTVVSLPDSELSPLCRVIKENSQIDYIQTVHEAVCVSLAAGLTVSGNRCLVLMENSGLRNACETIARLHLSHNLYTCYLISHRGGFGERNWWGMAHHETMEPLLELLRFRWEYVRTIAEFPKLLDQAFSSAASGQNSVALIAEPTFTEELRQ